MYSLRRAELAKKYRMTPAYHKEVFSKLIREANLVAYQLQLPENLPITESNIVGAIILPPNMVKFRKEVGRIDTQNYVYYVSIDNKFCYLESPQMDEKIRRYEIEYCWPSSRMDTNAAYQMATQWMARASMDIQALNRDCDVHVGADSANGYTIDSHFVPIYTVYWSSKSGEHNGSLASVIFLAPTRKIILFRVEDSKYILRKPVMTVDY